MDEKRNKECLARFEKLYDNMADYPAAYSKERPKDLAIIEHNTGEKVTWKDFNRSINAFAAKLLSIGLKKGDIVATSLPALKEHIYLMYACYRLGLIIAPLDLRLKTSEIQYCLDRLKPSAYFFLGKTALADFRPMISEVMKSSPYVKHWVQFQKEEDLIIDGAVGIGEFAKDIKKVFIKSLITGSVKKARKNVGKRDACLIIFTTGSTGSPKPALICHENILIQNIGLAVGFDMGPQDRMLVNLPPSHVGCTTEQLGTVMYGGGTSVLLHVFDAGMSMKAIHEHRVTVLGQIPALFNMEWRLPDYPTYDISSIRFVLYGGQAVPIEFLRKMREMAPRMGTGLGLTETAGFCTYTNVDADIEDIAKGIGFDMPITPISIREVMKEDGSAGDIKQKGEIGEICFSGPQVFLGYLNDPENTAKAISTDGICYTGDMGYYDDDGLHFSGRKKMVIKSRGYQVFPDDVVNHISRKLGYRASLIACVGVEHEIFSEAIMVFVEPAAGETVTPEEVIESCNDISAYSRPSHAVILEPGTMPLNRVAKVDILALRERAKEIVNELRIHGGWDSARN